MRGGAGRGGVIRRYLQGGRPPDGAGNNPHPLLIFYYAMQMSPSAGHAGQPVFTAGQRATGAVLWQSQAEATKGRGIKPRDGLPRPAHHTPLAAAGDQLYNPLQSEPNTDGSLTGRALGMKIALFESYCV